MKHAMHTALALLAALLLAPLTPGQADEQTEARFAAMTPAAVRV